jgi:hypothetical protein
MSKWAFYHDLDELKCEIVREAIKAGAITDGHGYAFSPLIQKGKERTGRLRLYGDAICVPAAQAFVESYLETRQVKDEGRT